MDVIERHSSDKVQTKVQTKGHVLESVGVSVGNGVRGSSCRDLVSRPLKEQNRGRGNSRDK